MKITCLSLMFLIFLTFARVSGQQRIDDLRPTIILISLDGFRWDYLDKYEPAAIGKLARNGVRARWMIPSFPTKTFPNHYTIATGLYPQNHGIVENNVYDFGTTLTMSNRKEVQNPRWWLGEPIWVTAQKQGQRAASYFFVGTETMIDGEQPTRWRIYNGRVPNKMRVDEVLKFLDLPASERPTMISMYFSTTDDVGHEFGPDAVETKYAVWEVDEYIERLVEGLKKRGIDSRVNIIIVSDHGMANYRPDNVTFLDDVIDIDKQTERILWTNEIVQIFPKAGETDAIMDRLKTLRRTTCWRKNEIPARLHYSDGPRVAPIICSSDIGWITTTHKRWNDWYADLDDSKRPRGAHGYDNRYQEMQATFIANGPAFKRGFVAEPFSNVEVYNVMCKILGLKPAKNDGDLQRVSAMLR
jgi:predicted AlkP superfamily pyrophosphatase or phosphodiesterase